MEHWRKLLLGSDSTIYDTLKKIEAGSAQIALVVDQRNRLLGTVTDGDIRRGILNGYSLEDSVQKVMNPDPIKFSQGADDEEKLVAIMLKSQIHQLPLVDKTGRIVGLRTIDELLKPKIKDNLVVIMSGGVGQRLKPLTNDRPKPMLVVGGGKPLLEVNIDRFIDQGFNRFCLTVGYKAEVIKEYFGNGVDRDIEIQYIHEDKPLGTAGALHCFTEREQLPVIVMNGDLLTGVKFNTLLDFHNRNNVDCTMCIREVDYQLPYGVVELDKHKVLAIKEKPVYKHFVNAGIYVLSPHLFKHVPKGEYYQMNTFLEDLIDVGYKVEAFPLMEYWSDIGQINDYEKACRDFPAVMSW